MLIILFEKAQPPCGVFEKKFKILQFPAPCSIFPSYLSATNQLP